MQRPRFGTVYFDQGQIGLLHLYSPYHSNYLRYKGREERTKPWDTPQQLYSLIIPSQLFHYPIGMRNIPLQELQKLEFIGKEPVVLTR